MYILPHKVIVAKMSKRAYEVTSSGCKLLHTLNDTTDNDTDHRRPIYKTQMNPSRYYLPAPLNYSGRRPLTPPLLPDSLRSKAKKAETGECLPQRQSLLFRLPIELRLLIWEGVLGGEELNITIK